LKSVVGAFLWPGVVFVLTRNILSLLVVLSLRGLSVADPLQPNFAHAIFAVALLQLKEVQQDFSLRGVL